MKSAGQSRENTHPLRWEPEGVRGAGVTDKGKRLPLLTKGAFGCSRTPSGGSRRGCAWGDQPIGLGEEGIGEKPGNTLT